ncbi:MAG: hypothetical protein AXA67_09185 [Methylothermaceae bacteria B42]|nr:MAG: hypothetical protein AXA67_09185 [Methylothermaceae bacteria B42]HHJ39477.1 zf-HC2 domain-containing protein [Methylothermaceae bacterium]
MLSCKEATELVSKSMDTQLPWRERLALRLHLALCGMCRKYRMQLRMMQKVIQKSSAEDWLPPVHLSEEAKQRILNHFKSER